MPRVSSLPLITSLDLFKYESNPSTNVGQLAMTDDGRMFRYVKAGGSALVRGNLIQESATDTNFKDMAVQAAVAVGGTTIPVTLGGTAVTANQFNGGLLVISSGSAMLGQVFTITSHDVQTSTSGTCNFNVQEQVQVALTTSATATVIANPYTAVIQFPATTATGLAVGGAVSPIPANNYGWIQTHGMGTALGDSTASTAAAMSLSPSTATAGAVTKGITLQQVVGVSMYVATVSAKNEPVFWTLD